MMWPAHEIAAGDYRATVSGVGGSLASLTYRGEDLIVPFTSEQIRPYYRGALLAPWPNRVIDGRYRFGGVEHQLAITEPERGHALHGLACWSPFTVVEHEVDALSLVAEIPAQDGYPHQVLLEATYRLSDAGLDVVLTAYAMAGPTPIGLGFHPYLTVGGARVDDLTARIPYATLYPSVGERMLPGELTPLDGGPADLREARSLAGVSLDTAYTDPLDGVIELRDARDGHGVRLITEAPWLQVFTSDRPGPDNRDGVAIEPMTCAPGAFNALASGDLAPDVLQAREHLSLACSISAI
ncbi:aldose 1-epimerase [Bowdeniella nasicola]|uniref:Aldose 1-epimerase n=1 Tax=Bowdeniella nasicola TaxID=208480 RepID=A0A1H3XZ24_9ACTO|nr:hypothetical protein [Bowdeniella nasicola]SEA04563.1 aldose 1-epimerase [Bowdeniella nasicola]